MKRQPRPIIQVIINPDSLDIGTLPVIPRKIVLEAVIVPELVWIGTLPPITA